MYTALLMDWQGALSQAWERMGLSWQEPDQAVKSAIDEFLKPSLRHYDERSCILEAGGRNLAQGSYARICRDSDEAVALSRFRCPDLERIDRASEAFGGLWDALFREEPGRLSWVEFEKQKLEQECDRIRLEKEQLEKEHGLMRDQVLSQKDELGALQRHADVLANHAIGQERILYERQELLNALGKERGEVLDSLSWRITKPLRALKKIPGFETLRKLRAS
jgi:hypothetical protein